MSVHGEYERTLENLILRLGQLPTESGRRWVDAFSALRMKHQPDLSTAAHESLAVLERISAELPTLPEIGSGAGHAQSASAEPRGNILIETTSQLRAHCQAILGVSDRNEG